LTFNFNLILKPYSF